MGANYQISRVNVFGRDSFHSRFSELRIFVAPTSLASVSNAAPDVDSKRWSECSYWNNGGVDTQDVVLNCAALGQWVRLEKTDSTDHLTFCEMEVWGQSKLQADIE